MTTMEPKCRPGLETFPSHQSRLPASQQEHEELRLSESKKRGTEWLNFILGGNSAKTLWFMHAASERLANHKGASCSEGGSRWGRREQSQNCLSRLSGRKTGWVKNNTVLLGQTNKQTNTFFYCFWRQIAKMNLFKTI